VRGSTVDGLSGWPAGGLGRGGPVRGIGGGVAVLGSPVDGSVPIGDDGSPVRGSIGAVVGSPVRGSSGADEGNPVPGAVGGAGVDRPLRGSTVGPGGATVEDGGWLGRAPGSVGSVEPVWAGAGPAASVTAPSASSKVMGTRVLAMVLNLRWSGS
jgi:hypothetical protein